MELSQQMEAQKVQYASSLDANRMEAMQLLLRLLSKHI